MPFFVLIFFAVYGSMHFYLFWKVRGAFGNPGGMLWYLGAFVVLMCLAPVIVYALDRRGMGALARILGRFSFIWMAIVFWFLAAGVLGDAWNLLVHGAALIAPGAKAALLGPRVSLAGIGVVIVGFMAWGLVEVNSIRLERVAVPVAHLPPALRDLKIVLVSDMHLGMHTGWRRLEKAIALIEQARPDILISTGDLVDSPPEDVLPYARRLAEVKAPLGKFAILGNHEFYAGLANSLEFHKEAGFELLRQTAVRPVEGLALAGVDDPAGLRMKGSCLTDERIALDAAGDAAVKILLKHQPEAAKASLGRFTLQLSGHTHGGQIFPFMAITRLYYRYVSGMYELPGGSRLYVSRGTGTWGPPLRLFAPPEVTLITFVQAD